MKIYMIDLDGTMYRGKQIIDGAKDFIDYLIETKQMFIFLTNNASRTKAQNVQHMLDMGFENIKEENFFTSAMAAAYYVAHNYEGKNAYYIGQDGLKEALHDNGFIVNEDKADFVFVGLDTKGTYEKYSKALSLLLNGAKLIGTNDDRLLAKPGGFNVGNGSIVAMFEYAINEKSPQIGKPHAPILDAACEIYKIDKADIVLIGDNLETDILLGVNEGVETVFVTSGVHQQTDIDLLEIKPNHIVDDLRELIKNQK